jgi:hypothetical protein
MAAAASADDTRPVWAISDEEIAEDANVFTHSIESSGWELFVDSGTEYKVWRHATDGGLYRYRSLGVFQGIPPQVLYEINNNLAFRKEWDSYVLSLKVVETNHRTDCVHWCVLLLFSVVLLHLFSSCDHEDFFLEYPSLSDCVWHLHL